MTTRAPEIAEPDGLFDLAVLQPARPAVPCFAHPGREATHRLVIAVNLLDPMWWANNARLMHCLCCGTIPTRIFCVGAGFCREHAERKPGHWAPAGHGIVEHYAPISTLGTVPA